MNKNREPDRINDNGTKFWYDDNHKYHNDNGYPAIIYSDGTKFWYKHGKLHNDFGPTIIYTNGHQYWFVDGVRLNKEQFKQHKIKNFIDE